MPIYPASNELKSEINILNFLKCVLAGIIYSHTLFVWIFLKLVYLSYYYFYEIYEFKIAIF